MAQEQNHTSQVPQTGEIGSHECLNCGNRFTERYCNQCGQKVTHPDTTLRQLFQDFVDEYFTFDSRVLRTLKILIAKPGQATVEYNRGRRARYAHPVKMYLFISFFAFMLIGPVLDVDKNEETRQQPSLNTETAAPGDKVKEAPGEDSSMNYKFSTKDLGLYETFSEKLNKVSLEEIENLQRESARHLPQLMFFLMPIFALLSKLFYRRTDNLYAHHIVFSLHFHTFFFIARILSVVLQQIHSVLGSLLVVIWVPAYLFLSLRRVFKESKPRTIWKLSAITLLYIIILFICLVGMFIVMVLML